MSDVTAVDIGLFAIFAAVLIGPFLVKKIENNLEVFLFIMGVIAATVGWKWSWFLVQEALLEPIIKGIVPAVLLAGVIFHYGRQAAERGMRTLLKKMTIPGIVFMIVVLLGLLSSVITAIIAALLLVELVHIMPLDKRTRVDVVIIACFSIGLGAVLTPLGEPLSTIAITKLQGDPYHAGFLWLFRALGTYVIPGVLAFGFLAMFMVSRKSGALAGAKVEKGEGPDIKNEKEGNADKGKEKEDEADIMKESMNDVFIRAGKVYLFVLALLFLGAGMSVLIDKYFTQIPGMALYWVNMISAVLDNATLTAAEIGPLLSIVQIKGALMGLLIAGGMLIPGNIPNIIAAGKLKITSREWARLGVPLGLAAMLAFFVWLYLIPIG